MSVYLTHAPLLSGGAFEFRYPPEECIDIAIINNMPDGALKSTERQFMNLLDAAAGPLAIRLTFFGLSELSRSDAGRHHVNSFYSNIEDLWDRPLDGIIRHRSGTADR